MGKFCGKLFGSSIVLSVTKRSKDECFVEKERMCGRLNEKRVKDNFFSPKSGNNEKKKSLG